MIGQHPIQPYHITLLDLPKPILPNSLRILFVLPAGMVGSDVDSRVVLVPSGQVGVCFGADGAERARDEVEDGADFGLAFYVRGAVSVAFWEWKVGRGKWEDWRLTSRCEKHLHAEVGISYAHEDYVMGFVAFEVVVPKIAHQFGHLCLQLCFIGTFCDSVLFILCVSKY